MERDLVRVRELYAGWKTEDLKRAVTLDKAGYEPWAINIIKEEIRSRNVNSEDLDSFHKSHTQSLRSGGKLFCPKCDSLDIKKERPWWFYCIMGASLAVAEEAASLFCVRPWSLVVAFFTLVLVLRLKPEGWAMFLNPKYQCYGCGYSFRKIKEKGNE
jgi:hypothetical protein